MADHTEPSEIAASEALERLSDSPEIPECFRKISHPKKRAFLIALTTTPIIGAACRVAGITTRTVYNWTAADDEDFNVAYKVARELGIRVAEDEAWKRATDGTLEDVYGSLGGRDGTGVVGQRRVKSDTLLIFMLKSAAPEKYRERFEHTGPGGGPIENVVRIERVVVDAGNVVDAVKIEKE